MRSPWTEKTLIASLVAFALAACAAGSPEPPVQADRNARPGASATPAPPTLQAVAGIGLSNAAMPIQGILTGGQPTPEQLEALAQAGFRRFVSLRPESEGGTGWEEADAAAHGHAFERLPIAGAKSLTRENVERFARIIEGAERDGAVLYCGSGNRVGAMLALKAHWVDGVSAGSALALGLRGGMTRLEAPVRALLGMEPDPSP